MDSETAPARRSNSAGPEDSRAEMVPADRLGRSPDVQIRAETDPMLVAEYAEAMLEGAEFPPIVIYQAPDGTRHLADGHHRADAAALAALKDPTRKAEVLAEIRRGTVQDALRHAMQVNRQHGKRLTEADYKRAIDLALAYGMVAAERASEVVPALVALVGCSIRTAQENSAAHRATLVAKRDRLIWGMHQEGRAQAAIAAALGLDQATVSRVVAGIMQKRDGADPHSEAKRKPPAVVWPEKPKAEPKTEPAAEPGPDAPAKEQATRLNFSPYLPLLNRLEPLSAEQEESGAVGGLPDPADLAAAGADPAAVAALAKVAAAVDRMLKAVDQPEGLDAPFAADAAAPALAAIDRAIVHLGRLRSYLAKG